MGFITALPASEAKTEGEHGVRVHSMFVIFMFAALGMSAPSITQPLVTPAVIQIHTATQLVVSARINSGTNPTIAGSIFLYSVDGGGRPLSLLGLMRDDGLGADTVANDGIFIATFEPWVGRRGALAIP